MSVRETVETPEGAAPPSGKVAPGPRGSFLIGSLPEMQRRGAFEMYVERWREYGDTVRFRMGPKTVLLFTRPEAAERILVTNRQNYSKGLGYSKLKLLLGNGLLISEGEFWRRQRRIAHPPFTPRAVTRFAEVMTSATAEMLARWDGRAAADGPVAIDHEMMRVTATIIGRTMLSIDLGDTTVETGRAFTDALDFIAGRTVTLIDPPLFIPTPANRRFNRALRTLDTLIYGLIAERRRQPEAGDDLLAVLLRARDEETGEGMSDQQLRDEVITFFLAGHETTALALSWTWYLLSQHPAAEAKLHAELEAALDGRAPTLADLPNLPYTRMVIEEAMRLYPPVWIIPRDALAEDTIDGYRVPKSALVLMSPYLTHRLPDLWEEPEAFEPERFQPERAEARPPFAYFPFGGGPRICIGNHFAMLEAHLIVAMIAQRYRPRLVPDHAVEPWALGTLRPRYGIRMTLERR